MKLSEKVKAADAIYRQINKRNDHSFMNLHTPVKFMEDSALTLTNNGT